VRSLALLLLVGSGVAFADAPPGLDDFYERTRERDEGFTTCIGYCDGSHLAALMIGAQSATPASGAGDAMSTLEPEPKLASGIRLGADLGVRGGLADVARTQLWADVLRVHATGAWITDLGWHVTAFEVLGRPRDDHGLHLSLDTVLAHRTELQLSDLAELQQQPYTLADVEAEVAPTGPYVDKDAFITLPLGVANRLRWTDGLALQRRTELSAAIAFRGFPKGLHHHAQLDVLRIKHTGWAEGGAMPVAASAWTLSAGYQRLPYGIDTLPIWALVGYEWAGPRAGVVARLGGALHLDELGLDLGPSYERRFELDPRTGGFVRVQTGAFAVHHRIGPVRYGLALEALSIERHGDQGGDVLALTPELAVIIHGIDLGVRYRAAWTDAVAFPGQRFALSLDWLL
jgi:hypothetical protein